MWTKILLVFTFIYLTGSFVRCGNEYSKINKSGEKSFREDILRSLDSGILKDNGQFSDGYEMLDYVDDDQNNSSEDPDPDLLSSLNPRIDSDEAPLESDGSEDSRDKFLKFELRTRKTLLTPEIKTYKDAMNGKFSSFQNKKKIYIIVHGITQSKEISAKFHNLIVSTAILNNEDCNVFATDWTLLGNWNNKQGTSKNATYVGNRLSDIIKRFEKLYSFSTTEFQVFGHQWGVVSVTVAANALNGKLKKIVAFDPLKPDSFYTSEMNLKKSLADHVQVIHTSGYLKPMGDIDFYPNGGTSPQPGCVFDLYQLCSSRRSFEFYALSSFKPNDYIATRCQSYEAYQSGKCNKNPTMPLFNNVTKANKPKNGKYYLTASLTPVVQ